jgi:hypothetical protein
VQRSRRKLNGCRRNPARTREAILIAAQDEFALNDELFVRQNLARRLSRRGAVNWLLSRW